MFPHLGLLVIEVLCYVKTHCTRRSISDDAGKLHVLDLLVHSSLSPCGGWMISSEMIMSVVVRKAEEISILSEE